MRGRKKGPLEIHKHYGQSVRKPHFQPLPHTVTDHKLDGGNKALAKPARPLILFPDFIFSHFQGESLRMRLVGSSPVMLHASIASDDNKLWWRDGSEANGCQCTPTPMEFNLPSSNEIQAHGNYYSPSFTMTFTWLHLFLSLFPGLQLLR